MQPPRLHLFQKNNSGLFGLNRSQPCARSPVLPPGKWSGGVAKLCRGLTPLPVFDQVFFLQLFRQSARQGAESFKRYFFGPRGGLQSRISQCGFNIRSGRL